jgi:hypothetical protein
MAGSRTVKFPRSDSKEASRKRRDATAEKMSEKCSLQHVVDEARTLLQTIWTEMTSLATDSFCSVAVQFAPADADESEVHAKVRLGTLGLGGGIYMRFTTRHRADPYELLKCVPEQTDAALRKHAEALASRPACCKDKPCTQQLERAARVTRLPHQQWHLALRQRVCEWAFITRATSLAEEHWNAFNRISTGSQDRNKGGYDMICSQQCIETIKRAWATVGGRDLSSAVVELKEAFSKVY